MRLGEDVFSVGGGERWLCLSEVPPADSMWCRTAGATEAPRAPAGPPCSCAAPGLRPQPAFSPDKAAAEPASGRRAAQASSPRPAPHAGALVPPVARRLRLPPSLCRGQLQTFRLSDGASPLAFSLNASTQGVWLNIERLWMPGGHP